jgi:hypothetical protein
MRHLLSASAQIEALCSVIGGVAERLGNGLQIRVTRFDSGRHLFLCLHGGSKMTLFALWGAHGFVAVCHWWAHPAALGS